MKKKSIWKKVVDLDRNVTRERKLLRKNESLGEGGLVGVFKFKGLSIFGVAVDSVSEVRHRSLGVDGLLLEVKKFNLPPNLGLRDDIRVGGSAGLKIVASESADWCRRRVAIPWLDIV